MADPRWSIVVPAKDRRATIVRTVSSLLAQTDDGGRPLSFEVVVVDDGSTDDTVAALEDAVVDDRLRTLRQPPSGVSAARNLGLRHARGALVAFVDADDEALPGWLGGLDRALRDDRADLAFTPASAVEGTGRERPVPLERLGPAFAGIEGLFLPGTFACRRDLLLAVGGYAIPLEFSENTELGLRLVEHLEAAGGLRTATAPAARLRIHRPATGGSHALTPERRLVSALSIEERHRDRLARDPRLHASYLAMAGIAAVRLGRAGDGRTLLWRAWRAEPRNPRHLARVVVAAVPPLRRRRWPTSATPPGLATAEQPGGTTAVGRL